MSAERIQHYREHIYPHVEGWVHPDMWLAIVAVDEILAADEIRGDVAEFGVHHGKFLFLIDALRQPQEKTIAVGIWDDPSLKFVTPGPEWDRLQNGALEIFRANTRRFGREDIVIRIEDTFSLSPSHRSLSTRWKFLSIDAGHTPDNVINDLSLGQEALAPGGFIALDDYLNPYWEGVTDGFYRFMAHHNRRLRPAMFFRNKLFLTTISEHRDHLKRLGEKMGDLCHLRGVCGHECLVELPRYT